MTTLMNIVIENEINRGKYSGMPLEAKYNAVRYVVTSGELALFERSVEIVNQATFAGTEESGISDAWECLASLLEFSSLATQMQDEEDANLVARTKIKIMQNFHEYAVNAIMKKDEIDHLMATGSVNHGPATDATI